ncbi:hypothetical protein Tco_0407756 [Tanacetum coccineum]
MESSNSNSKERELQLTQRLAKQRHSNCMTWFEQLETHLHDLYLLNSPYAVDAFKPAFRSFFGEEHQTFKLKMFHNLDQLRLQLERENLHGVNAKTCLQALRTQFKEFLASKGVNATDLLNQGWQQDFEDFTRCEPSAYRRELLENLDTLEAVIHRVVNTYGVLRMKENELNALKENGSQLHDEILHEHQIKSSVKMQSQDIQINPVQAMDDSLIVSKSSLIEPENNNAFSKSEIETQMQRQEEKVNMREAVDAGLVVTESSGTKPDKQDTSSSSGNYTTQAVDADIGPVNDEEPFAEVQLTALHNILANEQQHTEQSEPSYDTHLLETIDSNTTPTSTNMCHRGGEIDQDALLKTELLKTKDMVDKEIYNELSKRFLQLEKHCISLEIQIQQKEESFQSNKPCKNQEFPEFREFFVINDLKAQLLARTTLICNLKKQIKSVKETSNEAKNARQEEKFQYGEAVDAGWLYTGKQWDKARLAGIQCSSSGSYTHKPVDADIGPSKWTMSPFAEVHLTALHNILANKQQHTEQSEPSYDTHLLETIDSNTTPTSTNMCHRGEEIDQDALLKTELLKTKDMVDKEIYNELSKRFLQLEKHCISL